MYVYIQGYPELEISPGSGVGDPRFWKRALSLPSAWPAGTAGSPFRSIGNRLSLEKYRSLRGPFVVHTYPHTHIHTYTHTYIHYITLHYITLHYITLHYITLHYITLHYITLHYITLPPSLAPRARARCHASLDLSSCRRLSSGAHVRSHRKRVELWSVDERRRAKASFA